MKKYLKKILMIATATIVTVAFVGCGNSKNDSQSENNGNKEDLDNTIIVATNAEFPPYEYIDGQEIVGIDIEIMKAIGDKIGMKVEVEDMAFDSIIPALQSGKADVGAAGMTVSEERLQNVDFTNTYCKASQAIIVNVNNEDITSAEHLEGKSIGVQLGTTGDMYATDVTDNVERYNKAFEAAMAVAQGKIDAVVIDDQVAKSLASQNDQLKVLDEPFTEEEYALAVKKGNTELLNKIDAALLELKEDGTIQAIIDRYITE